MTKLIPTQFYDPADILAAMKDIPAKNTKKQEIANNYQRVVIEELRHGYLMMADMSQINNNTVPFSLKRVRNQLKRYGKPQKYWWDWLHANFPLVNIVKTGNGIQGTLSMAEFDIPLDVLLASGDRDTVVNSIYDRYPGAEYHEVDVDTVSLNNFIMACKATLKRNVGKPEFLEKTERNLKEAKLILMCVETHGCLRQVVSHSAFGRIYYKGPNLQSVSKVVRHAALGRCYEVDINNSVYAWKYDMMPPSVQETLTYTREYIEDKNRIRKQLSQLLFGNTHDYTIDTVKQVLTAISFGAKTGQPSWQVDTRTGQLQQLALHNIIKSPRLRDRLFSDAWMLGFIEEQKFINNRLKQDLYKMADDGTIPSSVVEMCKTPSGRRSANRLIAWAYQQSERSIVNKMLKVSNAQPILEVHDAIYFRTKPDVPSMADILQSNWSKATLSKTQHERYNYVHLEDVSKHNKLIEQQERIANEGVAPNKANTPTNTKSYFEQVDVANAEPQWDNQIMSLEQQQLDHFFPKDNRPDLVKQLLRG